ncbi:UDP-N-acetylmuramate dehydrogenase [Aquimarina intermedia]|uniref:UDP-N-acetylenolpyruvoylglucosamine reductase n=1 Tax=Aquimarina intermedia TaxID=350814 RepID=A0A5S5C2R4_9FLAO|nr:UDP-N-acetylmuramate dehydrogenase [Aquimarina intermedia]TYP73604.1 UDP-N-acetylmuramate dehydrogenase [Aquimarina intermedia]
MSIIHNKSLKPFNTFGIDVQAQAYQRIDSEEELISTLINYKDAPLFVLSGGSNMLLTKNIDALVLHIAIEGIATELESANTILVTAKAGENWHEFVQFCIRNNYGGLENLSLIPGYVGSAPIQNIGAYGTELKDTFVSCKAIEIKTGLIKEFRNSECAFGYRSSIFKTTLKDTHIITEVTFRLTTNDHKVNTSYGAIQELLAKHTVTAPTPKDVAEAVIAIRKSKLPDPQKIGNSGSFFKNPVVTQETFTKLKIKYPEIPSYQVTKDQIKIPAGWLIEKSGFKGKRWGDAGVHEKQALVLVNYGNATGLEILDLSKRIKKEIKDNFGIELETEVNII